MKSLICLLKGHKLKPTGRYAQILVEWRCDRCLKLYVSNRHFGDTILPADSNSDIIFSDYLKSSNDANPPTLQK